jgi:hypothetical protein
LVKADGTECNRAVELNRPMQNGIPNGAEREGAAPFGFRARLLPNFISNVRAAGGTTTACITWMTASNATSQVEYGTTTNYGAISIFDPTPVTNHSVTIGGLSPATAYYYRVLCWTETAQYLQPVCTPFSTSNYGDGMIFGVTNCWNYSADNLDGQNWASPAYPDGTWSSGPGLLWVDLAMAGPNPYVQPRNTPLPYEAITSYPYTTYYFRTYFQFTNEPAGATLILSNFVDDGAIYYLNGGEIARLHMRPPPAVCDNSTLASGFSCSNQPGGSPWGYYGNACTNCAEVFTVSGDLLTNLTKGTNLLAVEVHNVTAGSKDITFGAALYYNLPPPPPPPPFIFSVEVTPGETTALITWTTLSNATSQVEYGRTPALGTFTVMDPLLITNHSVVLTNLQKLTPYFIRVISSVAGAQYTCSNTFTTIPFYANLLPLTNSWRFTTNTLDGVKWQAPTYDDAGWLGQGPALLYIEDNIEVRPRNTPLPVVGTGAPWMTYYFRTRLVLTNDPAGFDLVFSNFVDDGAVFYLNGTEIRRLRMPDPPVPITADTCATGQPLAQEALAPDVFQVNGNLMTNLVVGTNCLAVEVHNVFPSSPDIVFGSSVGLVRMPLSEARLRIAYSNQVACVSWPGTGFTLQQAHELNSADSWSDVPGSVGISPYSVTNPAVTTFYRLRD